MTELGSEFGEKPSLDPKEGQRSVSLSPLIGLFSLMLEYKKWVQVQSVVDKTALKSAR